jgi:hypothetical protein
MTDQQILDSVRDGLAGARMHRPVDDILRRARTRRRARAVTAVAGAAVLATIGFAALPPDHAAPVVAGSSPAVVASLKPVSFTLAQSADGTYTFDVVPGVPLDTAAVEQALQAIGISAVVRVGERCTGKPVNPAPGPRFTRITSHPDGSVSLVLDSHSASPGTTLSLGLGLTDAGQLVVISMSVFATGTRQGCHKFTVFPSGTSRS